MNRSIGACLLLAIAGCTGGALPGPGDGGPGNDGSVAADLAGVRCEDVAGAIARWMDGHRACAADSDCTSLPTGCGLPGQCGTFVHVSADGAYLRSLQNAWSARCAAGDCACPAIWIEPACNAGVCGARMESHRAPVGEACTSGAQCETGECVTEAGSQGFFPGGYCTMAHCDLRGAACPPGSACRQAGDGRSYCLKDCDPFVRSIQCRDGYACCPRRAGEAGCTPWKSKVCQ